MLHTLPANKDPRLLVGLETSDEAGVYKLTDDIDLPAWHQEIVFDPQTSGGLLLSLPASQSGALSQALREAGVAHATLIGSVEPREDHVHMVIRL